MLRGGFILLTTGVVAVGHEGELLERPVVALELEALVVVVLVWVVVDVAAVFEVLAGDSHCSSDLLGCVLLVAAGGGLLADDDVGCSGGSGREAEEDGGDGELHDDGLGG